MVQSPEESPSNSSTHQDKFAQIFPKIDQWDKDHLQKIYKKYEGSQIRKWATYISMMGDPRLWAPALIIAFIYGMIINNIALFIILGTGFVQAFAIYYIIKHFFKRPRPFRQFNKVKRLDKTGHGYSFPSGHAHHSTLLMGLLWLYFYPQIWVLAILLIYNIGVGYSRMISGVHFPVDTIMGILEGYIMLLVHWFWTKNLYLILAKTILSAIFGGSSILL